MMRRLRLKIFKKNKRGFSLIELIVAMVLMAIISMSLTSIMGSTLTLYNRAEMQSLLYNVSQKLHIALDNELMASQSLILYEVAQQPKAVVKEEYQYCMQVVDGYIYRYKCNVSDKTIVSEHILLSDKSYRGASVTSFYMNYDYVDDRMLYSNSSTQNCCRIVYITTTIAKNGVEYTHTSAVRLYNMAVYGSEIRVCLKNSSIIRPTSRTTKQFPFVVYNATQFFEIS